MFSLRHWLADRSELVEWIGEKDDNIAWASEEILNLQFCLTAKHDAMLAASERSERLAGENVEFRKIIVKYADQLNRIAALATPSMAHGLKRAVMIALGQDRPRAPLKPLDEVS